MRSLQAVVALIAVCGITHAQSNDYRKDPQYQAARDRAAQMLDKAAKFLVTTQDSDGGWNSDRSPGISALALKALAQHPKLGGSHPVVARGVQRVLEFQQEDGAIYAQPGTYKNYETSVALSMLAMVDLPEHQARIKQLQSYLVDLQWDEGEGKDRSNPWYGGAGYGRHERPDISNTLLFLDALHDSKLPKDHAAWKKAAVFVSRCQMLGETNDLPFANGSTQGGLIYSPANGGETKAGKIEIDGREELRCYGSVTYGGLKSMVYAGLERDDPRVVAVVDWIKRHWTLRANPNMPDAQAQQGLYYYYHTFARALNAWGEPVIVDARERKHNWRVELARVLYEAQKSDGSWVNSADRWYEGIPSLTTAYSMLALQEAFPELTIAGAKDRAATDPPGDS